MAPNDEDPELVTELSCYYKQQQKQGDNLWNIKNDFS